MTEDGNLCPDTETRTGNGPLEIVLDQPSHGNYHALDNILNREGQKILQKGVRHITHHQDGFYILKDDNEDELINRGDVRGGFRAADYIRRCNVVTDDGILISDEWFDDIIPCQDGYFIVTRNRKKNLMDIKGNLLLSGDVDAISEFIDGSALFLKDGEVSRVFKDGSTNHIRTLKNIEDDGDYFITRLGELTVNNGVVNTSPQWTHAAQLLPIHRDRDDKWNVIDSKHRLLFGDWYDKISPSGLSGIYYVKDGDFTSLMGYDGKQIGEPFLEPLAEFHSGYGIVKTENGLGLLNRTGQIRFDEFTTVFFCDKGLWCAHKVTCEREELFYHDSHSTWCSYLHEVCISNDIPALLENNGVWFIPTSDGKMRAICRFSPEEL